MHARSGIKGSFSHEMLQLRVPMVCAPARRRMTIGAITGRRRLRKWFSHRMRSDKRRRMILVVTHLQQVPNCDLVLRRMDSSRAGEVFW